MSSKKPLFVAGPRLILSYSTNGTDSIKIAYAIGLNLNLSVNLQPVYVLGQYNAASIEPVGMSPVTGQFQIVRLLTPTHRTGIATDSNLLYGTDAATAKNNAAGNALDDALMKHLDASKIILSTSFDINIYLNVNGLGQEITANQIIAAETAGVVKTNIKKFLTIKDCRLTNRNVAINAQALINESCSFMGRLMIQDKENFDTGVMEGA